MTNTAAPRRLGERAAVAIDTIGQALAGLETELPPAVTRALIPVARDGYPSRASGAEPGDRQTNTTPRTAVERGTRGGWRWRCPCGASSGSTIYQAIATASTAAAEHTAEAHGSRPISYSDPTGDAASTTDQPDPLRRDVSRIVMTIERIGTELARQLDQLRVAAGHAGVTPDDPTIWCRSCKRLRLTDGTHLHSPIATRPDGRRRYTDLCKWCGEFNAAHDTDPPLELLRKRAEGTRITATDVDRALARTRHTPKRKKDRQP